MAKKSGIQRAVAIYGGSPTRLAAAVTAEMGREVSRQNIEHWLKTGRVPFEYCNAVSTTAGIELESLNGRIDWASLRSVLASRTTEQQGA